MEPMSGSAPAFVGRAADLERVCRLLGVGTASAPASPLPGMAAPVADLGTAAVLLAGDAGVGKTRLLAELRLKAAENGWQTVIGHCLDFGDMAAPYQPFTEIFGRAATESPGLGAALIDSLPALGRLMPGNRGLTGDAHEAPPIEWTDLYEAVWAGLAMMARSAPLLIVIEDIHWADRSTRDLLSFLLARPFPEQVAIIASYRGDDLHRRHPLRVAATEWGRLPGVTRVQLDPLGEAAVRDLVRSLHPAPLPAATVRGIVSRAEGNAFFVEELVAAARMGDTALPANLVDVLLVRLDRLDEPVRQVVRAASVGGRRVAHQLLARVVDMDSVTLDQSLRAAVETHVLVPISADAYAFRHALLAEAIYDDLLPGERVRLHAAYARVLATHEAGGTAADLARHASAAHDMATGLRASIEAGDEAMAVGGPAEAAAHYEHALAFLADISVGTGSEDAPDVDGVELVLKASFALVAAGNMIRAVALLKDQLGVVDATSRPLDRARLLRALAEAAMQTETTFDVLEATSEAIDLVPEALTPLRAQVVNMHARANADRRRDEEAARWAFKALDLGRSLRMAEIVADATTTLARIDERAGDPASSRRALEQAVDDATSAGEAVTEIRAMFLLGSLHYNLGDLTEAFDIATRAAERSKEYSRQWSPYAIDARVLSAIVAYTAGDWERALRIVDVTAESPPAQAEALLSSVGIGIAAARGDADAALLLPQLREWWARDGQIAVLATAAAIDIHGDAGDIAAALDAHDEGVGFVERIWYRSFQGRVRLAALALGQMAAAAATPGAAGGIDLIGRGRELADSAVSADRDYAERFGHKPGVESEAWQARTRAEHLRLRWLAGVDAPSEVDLLSAWEYSVATFEVFGNIYETARSRARWAAALRATGRTHDAAVQAGLAIEVAERLGAAPLLSELRLLAPTSSRAASSRRDEALTGREEEVLALVALGRSNRDIGEQLFISAKTVSVHVSNLMAKLGATGRTEAVAIARRRGLLTGS